MELVIDQALVEFRDEARTWLAENVPREPRPHTAGPEIRDFDIAWQRRMHDGGWAGIDWPTEYGGRGLSLMQQVIWYEEAVRARVPDDSIFGIAFAHAGPTLMLRGTDEHKRFHLPRMLRGESAWCQGFSEPDAGSDLASLRCRAVVDGDDLVISGQKIWTSYGQYCDYGELLVRTDPDAPKHKGITWVIMDMSLPGVDIRPITSIDGFPHNCEVFYNEVRVPLANVVGGLNDGWNVAMSTLAAERGPGFLDRRLALIRTVDDLIEVARDKGLLADSEVYRRLAEARAVAAAIRTMAYFQMSSAAEGARPGPETTAIRTFLVESRVEVARLAMDILGPAALVNGRWSSHWLEEFASPIAGGTKDIQKNIIGERVLGLPR
ncbi:acyl-CoA dehydrogenase family protein [Nocardia sp. NPDC004711]